MDQELPFEGNALNAVDAKGRVSVPSKLREQIAHRCRSFAPGDTSISEFSLSLSFVEEGGDYLRAYDAIGMRQLSRALRAGVADLPAAEQRKALAEISGDEIGNSLSVSFDSVGRLVLPEMLRDFAGIKDVALFWGTSDYFEIWNPQKALEAWQNRPGRLRTLNYLLTKQKKPVA